MTTGIEISCCTIRGNDRMLIEDVYVSFLLLLFLRMYGLADAKPGKYDKKPFMNCFENLPFPRLKIVWIYTFGSYHIVEGWFAVHTCEHMNSYTEINIL